MPTAARLIAAICFCLLGLGFASLALPYFEEGRVPRYWFPLNGGIGFVVGWLFTGPRARRGFMSGIGNGITSGCLLLFWVFFCVSFSDMFKKSSRMLYDGPVEAAIDVVELMFEYAVQFAIVDLGIVMAVGASFAGVIVSFAAGGPRK